MILFLADENFPMASYRYLLDNEIDVKHIITEQLISIKDQEVIDFAIKENRIIVTFDSDFGELIFRLNYKPTGVIFFRWTDFTPSEPGKYLANLITQGEINFEGYLTVIDKNRIRQRKI
jgi:predicted nuclease of predicted toxin-antitoxin system